MTNNELRMINAKITDEEAFEKFERDCHLRNLRPTTIKYYRNELAAFKRSLADIDVNKEIVEMSQTDIENYILYLKKRIKVVSINTRLRAIRAFFNFLSKNKLISSNPMKNPIEDGIKALTGAAGFVAEFYGDGVTTNYQAIAKGIVA